MFLLNLERLIMPDISKCANEDCPLKNTCYRYTSKPNELWQSYNNYSYNKEANECKDYWETKEKK